MAVEEGCLLGHNKDAVSYFRPQPPAEGPPSNSFYITHSQQRSRLAIDFWGKQIADRATHTEHDDLTSRSPPSAFVNGSWLPVKGYSSTMGDGERGPSEGRKEEGIQSACEKSKHVYDLFSASGFLHTTQTGRRQATEKREIGQEWGGNNGVSGVKTGGKGKPGAGGNWWRRLVAVCWQSTPLGVVLATPSPPGKAVSAVRAWWFYCFPLCLEWNWGFPQKQCS